GTVGDFFFGQFHPFDFRPYCRTIRNVEGEQLRAVGVTGGTEVRRGEYLSKVAPTVEREIHRQKRRIGHRVGVPETLGELDTVDRYKVVRGRTVREVVNVIEV